MRFIIAFTIVVSIMTGLSSCTGSLEQHSADTSAVSPHAALKAYIDNRLDGALAPGWDLMEITECRVPPGWLGGKDKGWHVVIRSAPDQDANGWRVACHFWAFPWNWTGQKRLLSPNSEKATAFYYGQSDRMILFMQPPENPAVTSMAVGQVSLALGVPDVRAEAVSQDLQKVKRMHRSLLAAAGGDARTVVKMVDRMIETRYSVIVFVKGRSDSESMALLQALRKAFPDKTTFVIHRVGHDLQDSIIACGRRQGNN